MEMVEFDDLVMLQALPHMGVGADQQLPGRVVGRVGEGRRQDGPARIRRVESPSRRSWRRSGAPGWRGRCRASGGASSGAVTRNRSATVAVARSRMPSQTDGRQATTATVRRIVWRTAINPSRDLMEDVVSGVMGRVVGARQRLRQQRVDLVESEHGRARERDQPGDIAERMLAPTRVMRGGPSGPDRHGRTPRWTAGTPRRRRAPPGRWLPAARARAMSGDIREQGRGEPWPGH